MEHVVLFAKTPRLHEVKTRLAPHLTAEQALLLHEAMLVDQTQFLAALAGSGRSSEVCLDTQQGEGDLELAVDPSRARATASLLYRLGLYAPQNPVV